MPESAMPQDIWERSEIYCCSIVWALKQLALAHAIDLPCYFLLPYRSTLIISTLFLSKWDSGGYITKFTDLVFILFDFSVNYLTTVSLCGGEGCNLFFFSIILFSSLHSYSQILSYCLSFWGSIILRLNIYA